MRFTSGMPGMARNSKPPRRRILFLVLCLLISNFTLLPAGLQAAEINLLSNPGFENDLENWTGVITTAQISVDGIEKHEGSKSLKMVIAGDGHRGTYDQTCAAEVNGIYKLSGFVKTETEGENKLSEITIQLYCLDGSGVMAAGGLSQIKLTSMGSTGWTRYETPEITAPAGTVTLRARINALNGTGTAWFDDLALTKREEPGDPGTLSSITVTPGKTSLSAEETTSLGVRGFDGSGNPVDLSEADITYTSSAPYIILVNKDGTVTAGASGTASVTVRVSMEGKDFQKSVNFTVTGGNNTVTYDFTKPVSSVLGEAGANWEIAETDVTMANGVRNQYYGTQVQSNRGQYITYRIEVPENGFYTAFFKGFGSSGGGIADLYIDDLFLGQYNFFGAGSLKSQVLLKSLYLDRGLHTLTFRAVERPAEPGAWGENMYLVELLLVPKSALPTLEAVEAVADRTDIAVGQTAVISAKGIMSNGYVDFLRNNDTEVRYSSSDETVAGVNTSGIVRAISEGTVGITVEVAVYGITKQDVVTMTVNNKVLGTVLLQLEKNEIPAGVTTKANVTAKFNDGSILDLKDAVVEFNSDNENVAVIDSNGLVTAVAEGTAGITVTVTLAGSTPLTGRAQISVVPLVLDTLQVAADKTTLFVGRQAVLTITGTMNDQKAADLSRAAISYRAYALVDGEYAENNEIVEINGETGVVTAKKPGTAKIHVEVNLDGTVITNEDTVITIESTDGITNSKTKPTYYTDEKVAAARENIAQYAWARAMKDAAVGLADQYADKADVLWEMVTPQSIPRSMTVNPQYRCPDCGTDLRAAYGNYPWLHDPVNDPWKLKCPNCGTRFPTNDFESYYKGGLDSNGIFDPVLAKQHNDALVARGEPGNLVNILYPEKGAAWGVDDGYGWMDENGVRQTFIAYYAHWGLWYGGTIQDALDALRDAYLYTGDRAYAYTGTILLDRIADVYPAMNLAVYKDSDGYRNSHGGTGEGKILGNIWETGLVQSFLKAYDAFYNAMEDEEIVTYLMNKATELDLDNPKSTPALLRKNIEDGIVRQVYPSVQSARINGNFGMHQAALALAAVVLDSNPETKEWLDFDFQAGGLASNPWRVTGGDIMPALVDRVDRDGHGNEAAPGYNVLWLDQMMEVANVLDGYEGYPGADLYKNPKFMKMFSAMYPLILAGKYTAQIGDTGSTGNPGLNASMEDSVTGFMKFDDPVLAQLAYFLNNNSVEGLHSGIFTEDPESVGPRIQAIIDELGELALTSDNLAGYGFAVLRDGENNKRYFGIQIPFANLSSFDATAATKYYEASGTVQFEADRAGHRISFHFDVPKTDVFEIDLNPFKAVSYGVYDVSIDGAKVKTVDFYGGSGASSNLEALATMELTEGAHVISFEGVGRNESSSGYKMGLIDLVLFDEEALRIKNDETLSDTQRDIWLYYGRNTGHGHKDTLNLGVHAYGLDVAPDLGYPEETGEQPNRMEWVSNTISHNTVVVDKQKQADSYVGTPIHFDDSEIVDIVDVDAITAYPQTEMYRRTVATVKVDAESSYSVDFFRIKGGNDHYYSFHGYEGPVATEGLNLVGQKDENGNFVGTYAGIDTQFGVRPASDSVAGWGYKGPGFHWLKNVEKDAAPGDNFSIDWDIHDGRKVLPEETNIHLRLTMLGQYDDVAVMDGEPPKIPGNPQTLKYVVAHRGGTNLDSLFTAVIEPYKDARYIESIQEVAVTTPGGAAASGDVKAVKVVLGNGRTDYIVNALDNETLYTVDDKFLFKGFLGVYSEKGGRQVYGYVNDGTVIGDYTSTSPASAAGTVKSFTKDLNAGNQLTVEFENEVDVNSLTGRFIYVDNDGVQNAAYKLNGIKSVNGNTVTFDLGATTLIRSYQDSSDIGKGYVYNIAENDPFVIPLSFEAKKNYAELEYIKLDNDLLTGFEPSTLSYRVELPYGANKIPFVTAKAVNEAAMVEITQAGGIPGKATIKVTDEAGVTTQTYEIEFVRESLFTAGDLRFTDANGNTMTGLVGGANIKASVEITNNSGKPMIGMLLLVLYNKNDRVVNGAVAPLWVSANSTAAVDAGLRLPARIDGHKIKAFIWDSRGGTTPLPNPPGFSQDD